MRKLVTEGILQKQREQGNNSTTICIFLFILVPPCHHFGLHINIINIKKPHFFINVLHLLFYLAFRFWKHNVTVEMNKEADIIKRIKIAKIIFMQQVHISTVLIYNELKNSPQYLWFATKLYIQKILLSSSNTQARVFLFPLSFPLYCFKPVTNKHSGHGNENEYLYGKKNFFV